MRAVAVALLLACCCTLTHGACEPLPASAVTITGPATEPGYGWELATDGRLDTFAHTRFRGAMPPAPWTLTLTLAQPAEVCDVVITPRTDGGTNGNVEDWSWTASPSQVDVVVRSAAGGFLSAAEFTVYAETADCTPGPGSIGIAWTAPVWADGVVESFKVMWPLAGQPAEVGVEVFGTRYTIDQLDACAVYDMCVTAIGRGRDGRIYTSECAWLRGQRPVAVVEPMPPPGGLGRDD